MKFVSLRILGFKTFVDPAEMVIAPGLTGVVGPNGCGKSNLVEALRWVMGETSHKSMRGSGMDDVIFSGSTQRPARNHAEVLLRIDNATHDAPAAFNDADLIDVSRRIEREAGSTYRINGREVRARDVQLLFADAASGARSPSMVRQGQISEIIAARPQARRRILEDAAGVAGLHARRHDAELKLKAAEDNLVRVTDVLSHIIGQIDALKRQARQAERYRALAHDIRKAEATALHIAWTSAGADAAALARQLDLDTRAVAETMAVQGQAERDRAVAEVAIAPLRTGEAKASEALQRLLIAREALEGEEKRAKSRIEDLHRRLADLDRDAERARQLGTDAEAALARLAEEAGELAGNADQAAEEAVATQRLAAAEADVAAAERALEALTIRLAEAGAGRTAAERALADAATRLTRIAALRDEALRQQAALAARQSALSDLDTLRAAITTTARALEQADSAAQGAERDLAAAREAEARLRPVLQDAERARERFEAEARTIAKLFSGGASDRWPQVLDALTVAKGYEVALGAALGEDVHASTDTKAPAHWTTTAPQEADPALPEGVPALAGHVTAPPALARRLAQIGLVTRTDGARLAAMLAPGQRLVSLEGDLWRWDGLTTAAEAPSPAARRLAERNRLAEVEAAARAATGTRDRLRGEIDAAGRVVRTAGEAEAAARLRVREARRAFDSARDAVTLAERQAAEIATRLSQIAEAIDRLAREDSETRDAHDRATADLAAAADTASLAASVAGQRAATADARARAAEARAALQGLQRERALRDRRMAAIATETAAWHTRQAGTAGQIREILARRGTLEAELRQAEETPDQVFQRRRVIDREIEDAEGTRKIAADARAQGETALAAFDRAARDAFAALSAARETRAGTQARHEAALERIGTLAREIEDAMEVAPDGLAALTGLAAGQPLPETRDNDARLADLRKERERLGAVNLRAEDELTDVEATRAGLAREHAELTEAIRRLRRGIESLNAEGRHRLNAAFALVNGHFQMLFSRLFGGGTAELQLIESDDPLEAGLEILAHPPGKKPQVLTLLSGGEQALTATALIFAVFLTNPSPVCVLDEVDAPLDDANVDRLCGLLADMARDTATRFIVITHNPITMARMDRLFGVTMAEKGISQLVSVDLKAAERLADAG